MNSTYLVTVTHPTNYHGGEYQLIVTTNYGGKSRYVSGAGFGCSRDYAVTSDEAAIRAFMPEHACTVVSIRKA